MSKLLDQIALVHSEEHGFDKTLQKYKMLELEKLVYGDSMLDVGCGIGMTTKHLSQYFKKVVGIDGSKIKIKKANTLNSAANIDYVFTMFETYKPLMKFDTIICTNVLEHMSDTDKFMKLIKTWLSKNGRVIITVPNGKAFHKLLALKMGVTKDLYELTQADIEKGHHIIFDKLKLENTIKFAGLEILYSGGILLKPFPNKLMESIDDKIIEGLYEIGKEYPDLCSSLVVVGKLK